MLLGVDIHSVVTPSCHGIECWLILLLQVTFMGVARIITSIGRTHLLFPFLGRINPKTGTPVWSTLFAMVAALPLAVLSALDALIDM